MITRGIIIWRLASPSAHPIHSWTPQALLKNKMGVLNEMFHGMEYLMYNKKIHGFSVSLEHFVESKPLISEECPLFVTYSY